VKQLPGTPDLTFPRFKTIVFVHGCFWHRHPACSVASVPKSNTEYWLGKFEKNIHRDREVKQKLEALGWRVIVVWECELSSKEKIIATSRTLAALIRKT
jgi:DNA mismatch endonuclease (patch repair protein)